MDVRQIWKHKISGDKFAVVLTDGQISEAAGPLHWRDVEALRYAGEFFDNDVEVAAELLKHADEYALFCVF